MTENPYQPPRDAGTHPPYDWRRLFYRALWIAGGGFAGIGIVAATGEPSFDSLGGITAMVAVVAAGIVFHVGLIIAIVAGIWWVITMEKRGPT